MQIRKLFNRKKVKYELLDATNYNPSIEEIKDFITKWNLNFPIDRWWRNKHKVAFNSPIHREVSFLDMRLEWEEEKLFERIYEGEDSKYELNSGDYINVEKDERTQEQKDKDTLEEFKSIDLSQYNEK